MATVELTTDQARYLAVIAAQDMHDDRERGLERTADRHYPAWEALQDACAWDDPDA